MKNLKNTILIVLLSTLLWSCGDSNAKLNKFADAYYEILIAREQYPDSTEANKKVAEILQKNGFTQADFAKESFRLYNEDQQTLTKMIDSLRKKAEKEIVEISKMKRRGLDSNQRDRE